MNYLDYWCEAMRDPTVEGTQVRVKFDPFNVSVGYVYIDGRWRACDCPYTEFTGCSERELHMLTEELRKRNRLTTSREQVEITQKQLAVFRRQNVEVETILRQQRHDRETRAALVILEGGKHAEPASLPGSAKAEAAPQDTKPDAATTKANPYDNLLVLKRIRLERDNQ
jgi:putative transposase